MADGTAGESFLEQKLNAQRLRSHESRQMKIPIQFDIMVTTKCNGSCKGCIQEATYRPVVGGTQQFLQALEHHVSRFYNRGGRRIIITGGEPLLELPLVLAVLKVLRAYDDLDVKALYTNGSRLLDNEEGKTVAALLANAALGSVNLSVHHHDDRINNGLIGLPIKASTRDITAELNRISLPFRFNLVLQRGGIATVDDLLAYVETAAKLGARDVYVREMAGYTFDQPMCASNRDVLGYTRSHKVSAKKLADALSERVEVRQVASKREQFRDKWEIQYSHLPTGCAFSLASNVIGSESREGMPYLVLMPDARLYRGWLGMEDQLEEI